MKRDSIAIERMRESAPVNLITRIAVMGPIALSVALVGAVQAEERQARALEEVVVTAQKKAEDLQDVAIAVTSYSGDDLLNFGVSGTQALQVTTPGLVFSNTGALSQPFLRGVGTRLALSGLEPSIAVYVDDRYNSRTTSAMFDFADIERVEVLKGPQGTLYGRNSTGGAIRIITKDVGDEFEGKITAGAGNFGYFNVNGSVNIPISETFGARISALTKQRDGYVDNLSDLGPSELDDQDYSAVRAKLRWDMSETATARLSVDYHDRDDTSGRDQIDLSPPGLATGIALGGISGQDADEVATAVGNLADDSNAFSAQLRFDIGMGSVDFASITTYYDFEQNWGIDADGTSTAVVDVPQQQEDAEEISQEFQLLSNNDGKFNWIVGANYFSSEINYDGILDVGLPVTLSQSAVFVDTEAWAVFGQATLDLTDRWSVTLGGRWSTEEKEAQANISPLADVTIGAASLPFADDESWNEFTPKLTVEYNADSYLLYATLARGFKSGGFNHPPVGNTPLDPEILDMLEFGFKGDLANDRVRLNAALFFYDYADLQVTRAADGQAALLTTENAADAEVFGLDVDFTWLAGESLTVLGGFSILDSEYKEFDTVARVFNSVLTGDPTAFGTGNRFFDAAGESLLRAPEFSAFLSAEYVVQARGGSVPMILSYSYKGSYDFDFVDDPLSSELTQDAYSVFNARVSYVPDSEKWSVAVWGNNLGDEEYFDDKVANASGLRGSYAPPRTYGVDVSFNF